MTASVLLQAWWKIAEQTTIMIFEEVHIRSIAYSELFQMVLPMVRKEHVKLVVMSATLNSETLTVFLTVWRHRLSGCKEDSFRCMCWSLWRIWCSITMMHS